MEVKKLGKRMVGVVGRVGVIVGGLEFWYLRR